jgi:hypothetical protein
MKCRLIVEREVLEFHPGTRTPFAPAEYVAQCRREGFRLIAPVGAIVNDPDCWRIVMMGQAEPADDECAERCKQTAEERAATLHAAARLAAGIAPEDFELFDKGVISGYLKDGSYKPGPNFDQMPKPVVDDKEDI